MKCVQSWDEVFLKPKKMLKMVKIVQNDYLVHSWILTMKTKSSRYQNYDQYLNIKSEMRSFKSNENIHKKEGGSYYVVSANKASSVTL